MIAHFESAVPQTDLDPPAIDTPLGGVVEQVVDRAVESLRHSLHDARFEVTLETNVRGMAPDASDRETDDLAQLNFAEVALRLPTPSQFDHVVGK